jgi:hypothetical protein
LYPGKSGQEVSAIIEAIRVNMVVEPVDQDLSSIGSTTTKKKPSAQQTTVPAFYVKYTTSNAREAQQICGQLTSLMVDENLKLMQSAARGTSDVLGKGLDDAKTNLDGLDAKLAEFKKKYVGQLPGDEENNLKILMGLNWHSRLRRGNPRNRQPIRRLSKNSCPTCSRNCCNCRRTTPTIIRM